MSDIPPPEPEAGTVLGGKNDHLSVAQPSVSKGKRWKIILQNIAVGTAVLGNIVALGSLALTTCNFNKQLKIQNRLAKKHIEEDYLRHALSVVFDCYNAADVYVSSWSYYKKRANIS